MIEQIIRARDIVGTSVDAKIKARIQANADAITRVGYLQARLNVCNAATFGLLSKLYDVDSDGVTPNLDMATGRIIIAVPWGDTGRRAWGLRDWEARVYRGVLRQRQDARRYAPMQLFIFNDDGRWYVDIDNYPTQAASVEWLRREAPTLAEFRFVLQARREYAADYMRDKRAG